MKVRILLFTLIWLIHSKNLPTNTPPLSYLNILFVLQKVSMYWSPLKTFYPTAQFRTIQTLTQYFHLPLKPHTAALSPAKSALTPFKKLTAPLKLFTLFMNTCIKPVNNFFKVHPSTKMYFLSSSASSTTVHSVTKLYAQWKNFYMICFNIFYYRLPLLVFGNQLFKQEILSLNYYIKNFLQNYWALVTPYLFLKKNRINNYNGSIFSILKLKNFNLALVLDTNYHQNTLFYLRKHAFFTLGPVPVTSNMYKVDFALPVTAESAYSHLFFIRLILKVRKTVFLSRYNLYRQHWQNY